VWKRFCVVANRFRAYSHEVPSVWRTVCLLSIIPVDSWTHARENRQSLSAFNNGIIVYQESNVARGPLPPWPRMAPSESEFSRANTLARLMLVVRSTFSCVCCGRHWIPPQTGEAWQGFRTSASWMVDWCWIRLQQSRWDTNPARAVACCSLGTPCCASVSLRVLLPTPS